MPKTKYLNHLRKIIEEQGSVTIATLMEEALTNYKQGYYNTCDPIGSSGDFITAPEISQLFGESIGVWCASLWQKMGSPKKINLIELGPGHGTLMQDIYRSTKNVKGFHDAIDIHLVEISPILIDIQKNKLKNIVNNRIHWHPDFNSTPDIASIIVANEFFDALPINQYIKIKKLWYENIVTIMQQNGEFCFANIPVSSKTNELLTEEHPNASDRSIVEISTSSISLIQKICDRLYNFGGGAIIIDYGYDQDYKDRRIYDSTLQAVKDHKYHPILSDIGKADMTAHVDFFALKKAAKARRCLVHGTITQREFLLNLGIDLRADILTRKASPEAAYNIISGLSRLIDNDKMGSLFKAMSIVNSELKSINGF